MRLPGDSSISRGFTLIELMVTIALVAIFMTLASTYFGKVVRLARERSVPEKFLQDFTWARGAASVADASVLNSSLSGVPALKLTLAADCSWTTSVNSTTDSAHSMTAIQLSSMGASFSCSGMTLPATFTFDNQGGVSNSGSVTFTGTTNSWPLQVLSSGAIVRAKVAS